MKIILAPDSFKDSLRAEDACKAMEAGIKEIIPDAEIVSIPMADGGEGTVDALVASTHGTVETIHVTGPLGEAVPAKLGWITEGKSTIIEMSAASGLELVPVEKRNPLYTTTFGTGELIHSALDKGCKKLIIGIGGSATTDCGAGMAQALGVRFFDNNNQEIKTPLTGELIGKIEKIDFSNLHPGVYESEILVACDVTNPLLGERGAAQVYGPQKGASPEDVDQLEMNMTHVIEIIEKTIGKTIREIPGTGAAGGLGAGLIAFLNAKLKSGISLVIDACAFEEQIKDADLILTGEGSIDHQSIQGKTISGIAKIAKEHNIPIIALGGTVKIDPADLPEGILAALSIIQKPATIEECINNTDAWLKTTTKHIMKIWNQIRR